MAHCFLVSWLLPKVTLWRGGLACRANAPHTLSFPPLVVFGVCRALSKTPAALALNQTQHCKQLEGLVSAQVQLCRSNLELMRTIVHAAREAMKACRRAFADMRWNCSSIELAPNYLLDLERGMGSGAPHCCGGRIQAEALCLDRCVDSRVDE